MIFSSLRGGGCKGSKLANTKTPSVHAARTLTQFPNFPTHNNYQRAAFE